MTPKEQQDFISINKDFLLDINNLIDIFLSELNQYENKIDYIQKKLERVKSDASEHPTTYGLKSNFATNIVKKQSYFCSSYENELFNNNGFELLNNNLPFNLKVKEYNGVIWAKYQKYIQNAIEIELGNSKHKKAEKFSRVKRVLILDYLGIKNKSGNARETAKLISPLLQIDYNSVRDLLREIRNTKEKDKDLLIEVRDYFKKLTLTEIAKQVQNDIDKIK